MTLDRHFTEYLEEAVGKDNARIASSAFDTPPSVSVRLNPFKPGAGFDCPAERIPWNRYGLMLGQRPQFTLDPCLHAGGYYVQDSSSMFTGHVFRQILKRHMTDGRPVRVLDLCAAPGGKTTDMAASLRQMTGDRFILVSNEVMKQRAGTLADNVAAWGDPNVVVTSSDPKQFGRLKGFFDIILADVPCSGEGMFRKDPGAAAQWSAETVALCQARQQRILADAWDSLADGGTLVYSTCTFNRLENDMNIGWLCSDLGAAAVFPGGDGLPDMPGVLKTEYGFLLIPGIAKGEGQFCSAVTKPGEWDARQTKRGKRTDMKKPGGRAAMLEGMFKENVRLSIRGEIIKAVPEAIADEEQTISSALNVLASGCAAGTFKGKDLVPSPDLALSLLLSDDAFQTVQVDRDTALAYLHRDAICPQCKDKGYAIVQFKRMNLGFIKNIGNRCNNLYPPSRRIRMDIPY